jgi:hypothetical protein
MADDKKVEGRTTFIEENMKDGILKDIAMKVSKMGDAVGFTQEDKYKGKTREEIAKKPVPEKKRAGGMVGSASKRADGCAQRGKTKGRIV